jgi:hypothetical protein
VSGKIGTSAFVLSNSEHISCVAFLKHKNSRKQGKGKYSRNWSFRKATQEIFLELDKTKAEVPIFPDTRQSPNQRRRGSRGQPHHRVARPAPCPRHQVVGPPGPPPDAALPPIYSPRRENLKDPMNFPQNILQAATVVDARLEGSRSSSRHPAGEGNHHRRPSSSPSLPPE